MKTPNTGSRRGWPVRVDGDTLDRLKRIQQVSPMGSPSYSAIINQAVKDLEAKGKK